MIDMKWIAGGAAVGAIASCWGYIKSGFNYFRSLFLITREVEGWGDTSLELYSYIVKNFYVPRLGNRHYKFDTYTDNDRRTHLVVAENLLQNRHLLAFRKGIPMWFAIAGNSFSVSYFRGSFNLQKFFDTLRGNLTERIEAEISNQASYEEVYTRFCIDDVWGSLADDGGGATTRESESNEASPVEESISSDFQVSEAHIKSGSVKLISSDIHPTSRNPENIKKDRKAWLDKMYLETAQEALVNEINFWLSNKSWYEGHKIPWKRGLLLVGPPGTGKSSLVFAVGRYFNLPIQVMHLNTMNSKDLVKQWGGWSGGGIKLIEDIDGVFDLRKTIHESKHRSFLTFDSLLNVLDGVDQHQGILTIITTNHPEKLDPALGGGLNGNGMSTRPGRVDKIIKFGLLEEEGRRFIANKILDDVPRNKVDEFMLDICNKPMSGAVVQELCTKYALEHKWRSKRK